MSTWGLAGPLLVVGLGMGLFVVSAFDTIIAAVSDAELGSASGALNSIQQFGGVWRGAGPGLSGAEQSACSLVVARGPLPVPHRS